MSEHWTDRLSDYLDGELADAERETLERHLAECGECASTLAELRRVVARAQALEERPPAEDLWPGIVEKLGLSTAGPDVLDLAARRRLRERRISFSLPQLLAAGIVLAILSGGTVWVAQREGAPTGRPSLAGSSETSVGLVADRAGLADSGYDRAVADLERVLAEHRDRLDPETVRVLEQNLAIIDRAIERSRQALAADPGNPYLTEHLAETMQWKLQLLRRATSIATAAT